MTLKFRTKTGSNYKLDFTTNRWERTVISTESGVPNLHLKGPLSGGELSFTNNRLHLVRDEEDGDPTDKYNHPLLTTSEIVEVWVL